MADHTQNTKTPRIIDRESLTPLMGDGRVLFVLFDDGNVEITRQDRNGTSIIYHGRVLSLLLTGFYENIRAKKTIEDLQLLASARQEVN